MIKLKRSLFILLSFLFLIGAAPITSASYDYMYHTEIFAIYSHEVFPNSEERGISCCGHSMPPIQTNTFHSHQRLNMSARCIECIRITTRFCRLCLSIWESSSVRLPNGCGQIIGGA